jgi:hypothetical protein
MVALTVHLNRAECVEDLVVALRRTGCRAHQTGPTACRVVHASALDEQEARVEVAFFLRAWESAQPDARASLT